MIFVRPTPHEWNLCGAHHTNDINDICVASTTRMKSVWPTPYRFYLTTHMIFMWPKPYKLYLCGPHHTNYILPSAWWAPHGFIWGPSWHFNTKHEGGKCDLCDEGRIDFWAHNDPTITSAEKGGGAEITILSTICESRLHPARWNLHS